MKTPNRKSLRAQARAALRQAERAAGNKITLALTLGLTRTACYRWRQGVPQKHLAAVSRLFGIPPEQLRPDLTRFQIELALGSKPK